MKWKNKILNNLFIYKNNSFLIELFYRRLLKELYSEKGQQKSIKFQIYNMIELPIQQKNNKIELIDLLKDGKIEYKNVVKM